MQYLKNINKEAVYYEHQVDNPEHFKSVFTFLSAILENVLPCGVLNI